jgi:SAM-dependent methyltransferase
VQVLTRQSCRACGSRALTLVINLGDQALASVFVGDHNKNMLPARRVPLELVRCDSSKDENACGLIQLRHTFPQNLIYDDYWYVSGINETMRRALAEIAHTATAMVGLREGDLVIDIGCNDGTLLRSYETPGLDRIGFDPARNLSGESEPFERIVDFFSGDAVRRRRGTTKARIVTSIAMFYDLERPAAFVADIAAILADDGVWILQMADLPHMLERAMFDNVCHEHLTYYHIAPFERLLAEHGLRLVDVEMNDINGSSYRFYIRHAHGPKPSAEGLRRMQTRRMAEFNLALDTEEPFERFRQTVESNRRDLMLLLRNLKQMGKTVIAYGASTKGNVILQYCGVTPDLVPFVADRNPRKHGTRTLGTDIPIISEEDARAMNPDFFLVLPYHFLPEMSQREAAFIERGGRFIVPVPTVHIFPR